MINGTRSNRRIKVVHLIEALEAGGAERLLYTNLKYFDRSRFSHTVITVFSHANYWKEKIEHLGVRVLSLECQKYRRLPEALVRLWWWLLKEKPDLLHTHLWSANVIGRIAGGMARVPVISSIHNSDYEPESWLEVTKVSAGTRRIVHALDEWTARLGCEQLIAVSEYVRKSTHHHLRFQLNRISLIYNPFDIEEIQRPPLQGRMELREELGLPAGSLFLFNAGRVTPQKGLLYAIRALPQVLLKYPTAHLVSAGVTSDHFWVEKLKSEAKTLGVPDRLHFLGVRRDVVDLMRACDLFLFPSLHEGLGIALIEAMAVGCACVATQTGPIPEVVKHGVDGWLVPLRDSESLAAAICALLGDPELRISLSMAAALSVHTRFQPQTAVNQLAEVYQNVIENRMSESVDRASRHSSNLSSAISRVKSYKE